MDINRALSELLRRYNHLSENALKQFRDRFQAAEREERLQDYIQQVFSVWPNVPRQPVDERPSPNVLYTTRYPIGRRKSKIGQDIDQTIRDIFESIDEQEREIRAALTSTDDSSTSEAKKNIERAVRKGCTPREIAECMVLADDGNAQYLDHPKLVGLLRSPGKQYLEVVVGATTVEKWLKSYRIRKFDTARIVADIKQLAVDRRSQDYSSSDEEREEQTIKSAVNKSSIDVDEQNYDVVATRANEAEGMVSFVVRTGSRFVTLVVPGRGSLKVRWVDNEYSYLDRAHWAAVERFFKYIENGSAKRPMLINVHSKRFECLCDEMAAEIVSQPWGGTNDVIAESCEQLRHLLE